MTNTQMDDFEKLLDETLSKTYTVADIVEGTVIKRENGGYLVSVKVLKQKHFYQTKKSAIKTKMLINYKSATLENSTY